MSLRLALAAVAALALAGPTLALQAPPPAVEAPAALTEADVDAAANRFEARMDAMGAEIGTAVEAGMGDTAGVTAEVDAILARYSPDIEAFASILEVFLAQQATTAETAEEASALASAASTAGAAIRNLPNYIRASVAEGIAEAGAAAEASADAESLRRIEEARQ